MPRPRWQTARLLGSAIVLVSVCMAPQWQVASASASFQSSAPARSLDGSGVNVHVNTAQTAQVPTSSAAGLQLGATLTNRSSQPVSIELGCGVAPALLLHSQTTDATYRVQPTLPPVSNNCHTHSAIIQPSGSMASTFGYELHGFLRGGRPALADIPGGSYDAQLQWTYTVITGDPAHRYRIAADGHIVDTFPTTWALSDPVTITINGTGSSQATSPLSPSPASASATGPFTPKVVIIDYNTSGTSNDGSATLSNQLANALSTAARYHGATTSSAQFQVYAAYTENNPPPIVAGTGKGDGTGQGDYQAIFTKYNICNLAATQGVNFVWIWAAGTEAGGPFYAGDFYEWVATGPTFNQTYGSNVPNCGHTVVTAGLNYSRTVAEALHSNGHWMENVLQYAFGPANYSGPGGTDMYDLFDGQMYRYSGVSSPLNTTTAECGDVHYPPNTTQAYDYGNATQVTSDCGTYNPGRPAMDQYTAVTASTWRAIPCDSSITLYPGDCNQESYLLWWMQNMPGLNNSAVDCAQNAMPNWWQYILALDTVSSATSNSCASVASITLSPTSGAVGTKVRVTGGGFSAREQVSLYWDSRSSTPIATLTSNSTGTISTMIRVPQTTSGVHTVYVTGNQSKVSGSAPFSVG